MRLRTILNVFSAAAEAVIALEGQQACCNDIINLLTTAQRPGWPGSSEGSSVRPFALMLPVRRTTTGPSPLFDAGVYQSDNEIVKEKDEAKHAKGQDVWLLLS